MKTDESASGELRPEYRCEDFGPLVRGKLKNAYMKGTSTMPKSSAKTNVPIYQLKITLRDSRPPIWRRVLVPGNFTLDMLHQVIQAAMGWYDYSLAPVHRRRQLLQYSEPEDFEPVIDERRFKLQDIAPTVKSKFTYEYDFGDSWEHVILVEKILPAEAGATYPVCVKGKRALPAGGRGWHMGIYVLLRGHRRSRARRTRLLSRMGRRRLRSGGVRHGGSERDAREDQIAGCGSIQAMPATRSSPPQLRMRLPDWSRGSTCRASQLRMMALNSEMPQTRTPISSNSRTMATSSRISLSSVIRCVAPPRIANSIR